VGSVSWLAPNVRYGIGKTSSSACGSIQFNGNLQIVGTPNAISRFIDFFNSLADASITKKLLREIERVSHDRYVTRASTTLSSHGIRYSPMLNNELLTPSHPGVKTQGDLKVSIKEIDDLRRGATRLSPNGRARDSLILEQKALNVQAASERRSLILLLGQLKPR
jgi:hypothetical protein